MWEGPQCPDFSLMALDAHSRNLREYRLKDVSATFFITKSLHPKKPVLNPEATNVIVSAFAFAAQKQRIYLRAFVVMPDHWHLLFALREPWTLPKFMHDLMSYIGGKTSKLLGRHETSWQDSYYGTVVKTARQFEYVAYYIEQNPVVKGLVERPGQWDGSSVHRTDLITEPWPYLYDEE
jgi:putative transposase